jgi:hypothetical protein
MNLGRSGLAASCAALFAVAASCSAPADPATETPAGEGTELPADDISVGELEGDDNKADGQWGAATTCKTIPSLPKLVSPRIVISLHGLTLRLSDPASSFDKVFPIGPGAIEQSSSARAVGESKSYYPVLSTGQADFEIRPSTSTACKIWWTDPDTRQKLPVFAGLPFLSWFGNYGIHGPVDNYRAADGGTLRRGFVSHGCIRMRGADVLEVFARIRGVARVPVHVQREPERDASGSRVDVPDRWLGAECSSESDCPYANALCKTNRFSGRGFCSARCTGYCPDRTGEPTSFCVADPDEPGKGQCVLKELAQNKGCRNLDHLVPSTASRLNQPSVSSTVCLPGSPGWVGDHCFADGDCQSDNRCANATGQSPGVCTQTCSSTCPDKPGWPTTFCVNESSLGGAACVRQCTPDTNASECPGAASCVPKPRNGVSSPVKNVCVPG